MGPGAQVLLRLRRRLFLLYCLAMLALVFFSYVLPASMSLPYAGTMVAQAPAVDGELSQVVSSAYGVDGHRRYHSESARVRHFRDDGVLTLEPLTMRYYADGRQTMLLNSEFGKVSDKGRVVDLEGAVELDRPTTKDRARETITTRNVKIETEQWIAVTEEKVTLKGEGRVTSGRGMIADLKRGDIKLLNEVRVHRQLSEKKDE